MNIRKMVELGLIIESINPKDIDDTNKYYSLSIPFFNIINYYYFSK